MKVERSFTGQYLAPLLQGRIKDEGAMSKAGAEAVTDTKFEDMA